MKERITFVVSNPEHTKPENFVLTSDTLTIITLPETAREDRLTFDFSTLPDKFKHFLRNVEQGHLRWSSGRFFEAQAPYSARLPAGLHVFTNPGWLGSAAELISGEGDKKGENEEDFDDSFLSAAWGLSTLNGHKPSNVFKIGQWAKTFYSPVESIEPFRGFLKTVLDNQKEMTRAAGLEWMKRLGGLESADYIDIKYDVVSQKVEASVYWAPSEKDWTGWIVGNSEVGVLGVDRALEEEAVKMAGYIYEVGESDHPEATMFSFPSRHHRVPATFALTTKTPTGLHPTLSLSLAGSLTPPREDGDCTLNAYFTLPSPLFLDKYQLSETNTQLLRSLNIRRLRDVTGNTDLEAPDYNLREQEWGSRVLIEIDTDTVQPDKPTHDVQLPLHLRYMHPRENDTHTTVTFAWPSVFWACKSDSWRKMDISPFDRNSLGWEDLFPEQVMYHHLSPMPVAGSEANGTWGRIAVPVLDAGAGRAELVKMGTVVVVGLGFVWVVATVLWARVVGGKKVAVEKKKQ